MVIHMDDMKKKIIIINNPTNKLRVPNTARNEKLSEGIAAYIGISSPETPKYLLTNNFLSEYFSPSYNVTAQYNFDWFTEKQMLHVEDDKNRDKLRDSFDSFLKQYLGEDIIKQENRYLVEGKHYYFPFTQEMLTVSNPTLRHMLFHLQSLDDSFDYIEIRKMLENYIFHDQSGITHILKILFQSQDENINYKEPFSKRTTENFWSILSDSERRRMKRLGQKLNGDLKTLLTHEYFCKLDFYRKYNYLSILLTSYVIQYIVCRRSDSMGILCKGAPSDSRLDGVFHRACCNNYAEIRNLFPNLLQQYYEEVVKNAIAPNDVVNCKADGKKVLINGTPFSKFSANVLGSRGQDLDYAKIVHAFGLEEGAESSLSIDDFVIRYIKLKNTRRGSVLTKISSILPTSGKQIDMIFPQNNAKHKYFSMSPNLTEFYVRLYLAEKRQQYDYLDNFIEHLQDKYRLVLTKTKAGDKMIRAIKPKLSTQEFARNKAAFIDTLNNINCLVKLSDSGFVVTLPEEKGALKLL